MLKCNFSAELESFSCQCNYVAFVAHGLHKEMGVGVLICLEQGADLHMAQLMPLPSLSFASVKSRLIFPL